jgi:hypothetical protein
MACRYDGIAPSEIKEMKFPELCYWADGYFEKHDAVDREIKKEKAKQGKG